ncbi:GAF domain-containing sensor histidine kinase [Mucilaginibacter ginkgonis]|uniref:histidine kinase n=1 Tax=Mucilaginibacter ginkgonis TaxID=2682091 RepID=A0A7T7FA64_9SPHI|nr:GAF domain-containing sensor histidine kinase [Mucilaginibacter ginkgonis]QQL49623.1 GAF domain-containing sensor histidine kinase [Mucilaginibacter ginkgonis]
MPLNEMDRVLTLAELDVDYTSLENDFQDLSTLAAKIAGTSISIINLIDNYTQWSVSGKGFAVSSMPREDSVCQYTITGDDPFEVKDLAGDDRFADKDYVKGGDQLRYYYGVPLTADGQNIGALCVLDAQEHQISGEKAEMLKIIAQEIVTRLKTAKIIKDLHYRLKEVDESKRRVAHDIRGPLSGVIGLANMIQEQGEDGTMDEVLEYVSMIDKSANSVLELANDILTADQRKMQTAQPGQYEFNLGLLKEKLWELYEPQAVNKNIDFKIVVHPEGQNIPFSKNKLLQIIGNIISNAMKFTPENGRITVDLSMVTAADQNTLLISITDNGVGMSQEKIAQILQGKGKSTDGTGGEQGFGFGLNLVRHLVDTLDGTMRIESAPGKGSTFTVSLPQPENLT